ncbi:MAG: glutathione S-transferase family protein [Proteobacteria bacterium]|nr:glutathione S-transferase family protein [Pseudomonadota bacterium]
MRLFTTPASPWVRRCVVAIMELGLESKVEFVPTRWPHTWATKTVAFDPAFLDATPVGRIPALVTDEGLRLTDSGAICDYLNAELGGYKLMPASGAARWRMQSVIAIANGLVEAQISRRAELLRDAREGSGDFIEKMRQREQRCFMALEPAVAGFGTGVDLAQIAAATACGYADFRYPAEDWRGASPGLAHWFAQFSERPSMRATKPVETPQ